MDAKQTYAKLFFHPHLAFPLATPNVCLCTVGSSNLLRRTSAHFKNLFLYCLFWLLYFYSLPVFLATFDDFFWCMYFPVLIQQLVVYIFATVLFRISIKIQLFHL